MIGVVVPTVDRTDLLDNCLQSLYFATTWETATVVIDNGDGSGAEIAKKNYCIALRKGENVGFTRAVNVGVEFLMARCTPLWWILILNDDVELAAGCIDAMRITAANKNAGVVGAHLYLNDAITIQHTGVGFVAPSRRPGHLFGTLKDADLPDDWRLDKAVPAVTFACALIRPSVWKGLGGLDEIFFNDYSDVDFCLRLAQTGGVCVRSWGARARHHWSSSKNRSAHVEADDAAYYEKWGKVCPFPVPLTDPILFTENCAKEEV